MRVLSEQDPFDGADEARDIAEVPAIEVINTVAVHLLSAAAVKLGLADDRDGLRSLQLAFREASIFPDAVGQGPGEKYTGPVN